MGIEEKNNKNVNIQIQECYEDEDLRIHFIGDVICSKVSAINYHRNPGYEICFIPNGKGIFKIENETFPISKKQVFMTKAPQLHGGWPSKESPYRILYICFSIKHNSAEWIRLDSALKAIKYPMIYDQCDMENVYKRLMREVIENHSYKNEMIKSLMKQYIILMLRNFKQNREVQTENEIEKNIILVGRVIRYMEDNIENALTLKEICEDLNYSISHLSRTFKSKTGFTVMQFYSYLKLEKAKILLAETNETVSIIGYRLGYKNIYHFSNSFKKFTGCSPSKYRMIKETNDNNL